jgi:hypothetical protein
MSKHTYFIIPYRDRKDELTIWIQNMIPILDTQFNCSEESYQQNPATKPYTVLFIHQKDERLFNRGACCNIGAHIIKDIYCTKNNLKLTDITIVIHDVDIYLKDPYVIKYTNNKGEVRHPYGDQRPQFGGILGCLCICNLGDYFKVEGMPNYWGWGGEDVCLARRFLAHNFKINEDDFIHRRTIDTIVDPDSAPTEKKRKFNMVCDKRNLRECFKENHLKPNNGILNCKFDLLSENYIEGFENVKNVKIFNILINII